ncbi:MAG: tryptophan synthase subunit alpha [Anaerolineales bacterium]
MNPNEELLAVFQKERAACMPYFTLGYPDMETSLEIIQACAENGADLIEIGIPFSDPLADGPTIQHSTQVALENGTTLASCLDGVKFLRSEGVTIPLVLMGYFNPVLAYGLEHFVSDARSSHANGFIIPDLPPDEASEFQSICEQNDLAINYLLAPNSPKERIKLITQRTTGFVYLVSITGITGARRELPTDLREFASRVRTFTNKPLAVGFGISTPEQAKAVAEIADGVIIGSALIKAVMDSEDHPEAAGRFVRNIVIAMEGTRQKGKQN